MRCGQRSVRASFRNAGLVLSSSRRATERWWNVESRAHWLSRKEYLAAMRLSTIEGDFLRRLSVEPWTSPPVFDHGLLDRVVRENYVTTLATGHGVRYEITDLGRAEILKAG